MKKRESKKPIIIAIIVLVLVLAFVLFYNSQKVSTGKLISPTCTDTCTSKGFNCGSQYVCGIRVNCGTCSTGYACNTLGRCVGCANGASRATSCGVGACSRAIAQTCSGGAWVPSCVAGSPVVEVCNNIDDDCNGVIDNGLSQAKSCTVGIGSCARTGTQTRNCIAGTWGSWGRCSASAGNPVAETCNNIDDNCDGVIDNIGTGCCLNSQCPTGKVCNKNVCVDKTFFTLIKSLV